MRRSLTAAQIAGLQSHIPGSMHNLIEGSNNGGAAGDQHERAQHAPAVMSPLTLDEQRVCEAVHGYVAQLSMLSHCSSADHCGQLVLFCIAGIGGVAAKPALRAIYCTARYVLEHALIISC